MRAQGLSQQYFRKETYVVSTKLYATGNIKETVAALEITELSTAVVRYKPNRMPMSPAI